MDTPRAETPSIQQPSVADLVTIWQDELIAVADLCEPLTDEQLSTPTLCPGWTVADILAHVIDMEAVLSGQPRPAHEPDWDRLPHASGPVGRFTEVGVDVRRGRSKVELLDELRALIPVRRAQLDGLPVDAEAFGPMGRPMTLDQLLRMRIFDTWAHEEDIRTAIKVDGGWNSDAAGISFVQIVGALPYLWARNAKAPAGSTLCVVIVGPDLHHEVCVSVDDDGKGVRIPYLPNADVQLDIMWAALVQLACGRIRPDDPSLADRVEIRGDEELGKALLAGMTITP